MGSMAVPFYKEMAHRCVTNVPAGENTRAGLSELKFLAKEDLSGDLCSEVGLAMLTVRPEVSASLERWGKVGALLATEAKSVALSFLGKTLGIDLDAHDP
jgi:hypothetical protein